MKISRFSELQIVGILKQAESGVSLAELCREHGMSEARNDAVNFCSGVIVRRDTREHGHGRRCEEMDSATEKRVGS